MVLDWWDRDECCLLEVRLSVRVMKDEDVMNDFDEDRDLVSPSVMDSRRLRHLGGCGAVGCWVFEGE